MDGWWPYDDVDPIPIVFHNLWALQKFFCLYIPSHTLPLPTLFLSATLICQMWWIHQIVMLTRKINKCL